MTSSLSRTPSRVENCTTIGLAQATMRYAAHDTVIRDVTIRKRDPIVTLMAAANRDAEEFENADDLVLDRSPNRHLAFGSGPHFCVGAEPAMRYLEQYVRHLADWESELVLAGPPAWLDTATLRCLERLPVARTEEGRQPHGPAASRPTR